MKKTIPFFLVFSFLLLCGCSSTVEKTDETAKTTTEQSFENETTTQNSNKTDISEEISSTSATVTERKSNTTYDNKTTTKKDTTSSKSQGNKEQIICTIEISCKTVLDNKDNLKSEKLSFVPSDGIILKKTSVSVEKGSTVFDVLKAACKNGQCSDNCKYCSKSGVQLEYSFSPGYNSYYVEGIHQIYEKDCGTMSGWMYSVNDTFPNFGCSSYEIKNGDNIKWLYTCDLGEDIGNTN